MMTSNLQVKMMCDLTMRCLYPAVRIWGRDIAGLWTSRSRKAASSLFRASSQSGQSDLDLAFLRLVGAKSLPVGSYQVWAVGDIFGDQSLELSGVGSADGDGFGYCVSAACHVSRNGFDSTLEVGQAQLDSIVEL